MYTQGGAHKRRSIATAGVLLFKGPQARRYTHKAVHRGGGGWRANEAHGGRGGVGANEAQGGGGGGLALTRRTGGGLAR